jgi:hypothetical protein
MENQAIRTEFIARARDILIFCRTSPLTHQASYPMGTVEHLSRG